MDQGVIYTAKRLYKNKFLIEILEIEEPAAGEENRRGQKTLHYLKDYNISVCCELWLEADEDDPGYHILTEKEIVQSVIITESSEMD